MSSFLKNWTHDGGESSPDSGLKAKELGLLEKIDRLLEEVSPEGFVAARLSSALKSLDECKSCQHG